jgi:hypothetical protein
MALKTAGIWYRQSGDEADKQAIYQALKVLDKYHGQANGIFTCDEHLAGTNPSQGTELCTVVEAQYSLEILESVLGDPLLADRLERITFNALPATIKSSAKLATRASTQTTVRMQTPLGWNRISAAAPRICIRAGRNSPVISGCGLRTTG